MNDLQQAKDRLVAGGHTCVLCGDGRLLTSDERGVKPLIRWLINEAPTDGLSAADKVIGKATAFLYVRLHVTAVYAAVISRPALAVLHQNGIAVEADCVVDHIQNRQKTGLCPFEQAVLSVDDPKTAVAVILETMTTLGISLS